MILTVVDEETIACHDRVGNMKDLQCFGCLRLGTTRSWRFFPSLWPMGVLHLQHVTNALKVLNAEISEEPTPRNTEYECQQIRHILHNIGCQVQ